MKILLHDAQRAKDFIPRLVTSLPKDAFASPFRNESLSYLTQFASRGKTLRGALVCLGSRLAGVKPTTDTLRAGAAIEILHSSLLIQDDVMDQDAMRRGSAALHALYAKKYKDARTGESLAMCAADIGFFAGLSAINALGNKDVVELACFELAAVGAGQMEDVACDGAKKALTQTEILSMYEQKTGRYSIYWPLATGWLLAGGSKKALPALMRFSLPAGVLYQITDDTLGLLSPCEKTGKPQGSDIAANKKTILRERIFARSKGIERKELSGIFGKPVSKESLARVIEIFERSGAKKDIADLCDSLGVKAAKAIAHLPGDSSLKEELKSFLAYIHSRNK